MKTSELRKKSVAELGKFLVDEREVLRTLRFKHAGSELKNVRELGLARRAIAKALTLIGEAKKHASKDAGQSVSAGKPAILKTKKKVS